MKIEIKNKNETKFGDIQLGDIFASAKNELFLKCTSIYGTNAIGIRTGEHHSFNDSAPVKVVKAITVEIE